MENNTAELSKYRIQQARQCIKSAKTLVHINDYRDVYKRQRCYYGFGYVQVTIRGAAMPHLQLTSP